MPASKIRLSFFDGQQHDITVTPRALVAAERRWGDELGRHQIESGFYMAWVSSGMPGGPDGFESWLETIESAEEVADPTTAATPSELSPQ